MLYFCITGEDDLPLFQSQFGKKAQKEDLNQFIIHASLDLVEQKEKRSNQMYLGNIDKFNEFLISAFVSVGGTRFLLLHKKQFNDAQIRPFFNDVYLVYLKVLILYIIFKHIYTYINNNISY